MMTADVKQFKWMQNINWIENDGKGNAILDENRNPIIKADAPPEAWESYRYWLKKEAERAERRKKMQDIIDRAERGELDE